MAGSRFYEVQTAFTGSETQVGPYVDPCKTALGMKNVGKHGQHALLDQSLCSTLPGCKTAFLDSQVTGACFMLQRSTGGIPVSASRATEPAIARSCEQLRSIQTFGGYLVDVTGFGKTNTSLLFASQYALYANHGGFHRPMLIAVPNGAVFSQWQENIYNNFQDLFMILSNDDRPSEAKFYMNWVSSTAMREAPEKLDNWPDHLNYIFDTTDPRASRAVILTPYDSHAARTIRTEWREKPQQAKKSSSSAAGPDVATKKPKKKKGQEPLYFSRWHGRFQIVLCDEGHKIRHPSTKVHASIAQLQAPINWLLTATPIMNTSMVRSSFQIDLTGEERMLT